MLIFDLIILGILVWAFFAGIRNGIAVQVAGLAGLFAGAYLAFRFGRQLGLWLGISESTATVAGFVILFIATIIVVVLLGKLLRGMFKLVGLGFIDRLGGAVLSLLKVGLILALAFYCFDSLNRKTEWFTPEELDESRLYGPMVSIADKSFPFINMVKDAVVPQGDTETAQESEASESPQGDTPQGELPADGSPHDAVRDQADSIPVFEI